MITNLRSKLERLSVKQHTAPPKHDISADISGEIFSGSNGAFIIKKSCFALGTGYGDGRLENNEELFGLSDKLVFMDTISFSLCSIICMMSSGEPVIKYFL